MKRILSLCSCLLWFVGPTVAQHAHHAVKSNAHDIQPLIAQVRRLCASLSYLGNPLPKADFDRLNTLLDGPRDAVTAEAIGKVLDPYCLQIVTINPEARVSVERGNAPAELMQHGWRSFLVKVHNDAGATAALVAESPNALRPFHSPSFDNRVKTQNIIPVGQAADRFLEAAIYTQRPMLPRLSGQKIEYAIIQLYSKEAGSREATIGYHVGQGTQDIGFRHATPILFKIKPAVKVILQVKDTDGSDAMASLTVADDVARFKNKPATIYPLPSRRLALTDTYPDFFFQPQVYRQSGEHLMLAPGRYHFSYTRGPEYVPQRKDISIPEGVDSTEVSFQLKRWIDMSRLGWHSADHHIHASGCSHYDSPEEGVKPEDMWRQTRGEDLSVSALLAWGPGWYTQKKYFTGQDDVRSGNGKVMHNDVEVSGFPSSHAGHIVLLGLKEDDYSGTDDIEQWPSWTLPVLRWAKSQNGLTGYAHSGWGLEPVAPTQDLPNYVVPKMDGIGANEYVVTVTKNVVDFYSAGDTPWPWELNMYYHSLNAGFKTKLSGETDFPCITDARVGQARSYFKAAANYTDYLKAIKNGRSYVSDGKSHLMDFSVNGVVSGTAESTVRLAKNEKVEVTVDVAAYLPEQQDSLSAKIAATSWTERPYWDVERARVGKTRRVSVELVVNGVVAGRQDVEADGSIQKLSFPYPVTKSCWMAVRVPGSAHSNPVFVELKGKPVAEGKSIQWCLDALEQCWKTKSPNIREGERVEAGKAYDAARLIYKGLLKTVN